MHGQQNKKKSIRILSTRVRGISGTYRLAKLAVMHCSLSVLDI